MQNIILVCKRIVKKIVELVAFFLCYLTTDVYLTYAQRFSIQSNLSSNEHWPCVTCWAAGVLDRTGLDWIPSTGAKVLTSPLWGLQAVGRWALALGLSGNKGHYKTYKHEKALHFHFPC